MRSHWPTSSFLTTWSVPSFYTEVLGGKTIRSGEPTYVALANSWIIINVGGGPTDDKPAVTLKTPRDPGLASSFLNIRVSDIQAVYAEWRARGAEFLTPPKQHKTEIRSYMRDPDGDLIEVGADHLPGGWASSEPVKEGVTGSDRAALGRARARGSLLCAGCPVREPGAQELPICSVAWAASGVPSRSW